MSTSHTESKVDMTQPASLLLRAGTIKIHDEISKSKTATYLTKGELDREEYIRYLMMLWHIYKYVRFSPMLCACLFFDPSTLCVRGLGCSKRVWMRTQTTACYLRRITLPCSLAVPSSHRISLFYWEFRTITAHGRPTRRIKCCSCHPHHRSKRTSLA